MSTILKKRLEGKEQAAMAIFGCWLDRPRLPDDRIQEAWNRMDDAMKKPWRDAADYAISAWEDCVS